MKKLNRKQLIGLLTFASRYPLLLFRTGIKDVCADVLRKHNPNLDAEDDFLYAIKTMRHLPDAVAFPDPETSDLLGLERIHHILFIYTKRTTDLSLQTLDELSVAYDLTTADNGCEFATFIVDGYGQATKLDLGGIWCALQSVEVVEKNNLSLLDSHATRKHFAIKGCRDRN